MIKIVPKVWGEERWVCNEKEYCGKVLLLKKGFQCSVHHHKLKKEHFLVIKGKVYMETDKRNVVMFPGDSIKIKPKINHRFTGMEDSEIIEFSTHHMNSDSYRMVPSGKVDLSKLKIKNG